MNLYITADKVGRPDHGGGSVTGNESEALKSLGPCEVWGRDRLQGTAKQVEDPWGWDSIAVEGIENWSTLHLNGESFPKLAHFYAGCFSKTVQALKRNGCRTTYVAAAHDKDVSREEHFKLGLPYPYPHLTEPDLWKRYLQGYLDADVLIVPSQLSKRVMEFYGAKNRIEVIPHGINMPRCKGCDGVGTAEYERFEGLGNCIACGGSGIEPIRPLPKQFVVGNLGACGADKGLVYLLQAWKKLNYPDAVLKFAGPNSHSPWFQQLVHDHGGGNIVLEGWVSDPAAFYNSLSLYCQPSVSEGFGISVLEAMSYGRPVICSDGAGAADCVPEHWVTKARDVDDIVANIRYFRTCCETPQQDFGSWDDGKTAIDMAWIRKRAAEYTWDSIKRRYVEVWKGLLA